MTALRLILRIVLLVAALLGPGCAIPVTIVESPWKAAPTWRADQHRRMAARFDAWMEAAERVSSVKEVAARLAAFGVVIVGESHDDSRQSKALVRALLDQGPAEVWEEAIIWRYSAKRVRLQGLYSKEWQGSEAPGRKVVAGGDRFNAVFASLARDGLLERLIVYAGNAHAIHSPEIDGPEPRAGGPLPADAVEQTGRTAAAIAVYPRAQLTAHLDLNMAVALLAAVSRGDVTLSEAIDEAAWCEAFLDRAAQELADRGDLVIQAGPGRFIAAMSSGRSRWSMRTVAATRTLFNDGRARAMLISGASVELTQRAVSNVGRAYEEFVFEVKSPGGGSKTFRVTRRGVSSPE